MASTESEVVAANEAFYQAFARRDLAAMDSLWAEHAPVACIHPGWDVLLGREDVMESWRAIFANPEAPRVRCDRPNAVVQGETAFVVCIERVGRDDLIATNTFVREDDAWRMVHHQAGPLARRKDPSPPTPRSPHDLN